MTPQSTAQNLVLWGAAFALSILLAFLSGIATHWPEAGGVDWRGVWLDTIQVVLAEAPIIAAGIGLPRLGKEAVASLTSQVGIQNAVAALADERDRQAGLPVAAPRLDPADVDLIVEKGLQRMREEA